MPNNDLISRTALLAAYDATHKGPPGRARKLIEEAPTVGGWISVTNRLPGVGGRYLVYNVFYGNALAFVAGFSTCLEDVDDYDFDGEKRPGWFNYDDEYGFYEIDGITHWMPLPEPPKDGRTK